jgi:hypothetical protein
MRLLNSIAGSPAQQQAVAREQLLLMAEAVTL